VTHTVAVTGASGFLGRHVVETLSGTGCEVIRIGRGEGGQLVRLDESECSEVFANVDVVVHLAGQLSLGPGAMISDYLQSNVELTERVALAAIDAGASRLVFASSRLVYPSTLEHPAKESEACPDTAYGMSKYLAEQVIQYLARESELSCISLRLSQLVGSGDGNRGVLARFATAANDGGPVTVSGDGVAVRDFLDVRDAALAVRSALDAEHPVGVVNIGGGPRSVRELARSAVSAAGQSNIEIVHEKVQTEDQSYWALDISLAASALGWKPQYSLEEALRFRQAK
jgi:nucleoside-diphosphate-sugar epimerase